MKINHSSGSGPARSTAPQIIFTNPISKPVPKRSQVSRACDWCRALRIKCDNLYPCRNCQNRTRPCNPRGVTATLSRCSDLSQKAALQKQEKDLEKQLDLADAKTEDYDVKSTKNDTERLLQDSEVKIEPSPSVSVPPDVEKLQTYTGLRSSETLESYPTQPPDTLHRQIYGRPSCVFFIGRLSPHLDLPPIQMTMSGLVQSTSQGGQTSDETSSIQVSLTETYLTKSQEEYFLQVFFPTYNVYYPIVDHNEFLNHYKSLWTSPTTRKQSALVDIVLALSMQYANALMPRDKNLAASCMNIEGIANVHISIASRSFFRRCQLLLNDELEEPSLTTVQCRFFSVVYLWNSYLHNAAHTHLAMAIRTGVILGIHWRPAPTLSEKQAEFQKRLWWTVYALELKMSMALGRPPSITLSQIPCPPPDRHQEDPFTHQGTNRFTANRNFIRLMLAGHAAYTALQTKCSEVLGQDDNRTIESLYEDPALLETVAEGATSTATYHFRKWQQEFPDPLKTKRQNSGEPLSTDRSALNLKESVPLGMSRQRLFLELLYHTLSMNIFRFFIYFPSSSSSSSSSFVRQTKTPVCDSNAILSVNHAITITNIVYQVLQESNFLAGFHDTFQWQWNATLTLIAFLTAFPHGPLTTPARDALTTAINVFDIIGKYLGIACTAAKVARELFARVDYLSSSTTSSNGLDYTSSNTAASFTCADMQSWRYSMDWNLPVGHENVAGGSRVYGNSETISDIASPHCNDLAVFESMWIALQEEQGRLEGNFEFHI